MSLTGALNIGRSALVTSQTALEVTGNNLANAATEGYTRQKAVAAPGTPREIQPGQFVGTGVRLQEIARQVNEALNQRLRAAGSDHQGAMAQQNVLAHIEGIHGELSDAGLTTRLERFFDAWSQLASNPTDESLKGLVISEGQSLAAHVGGLRQELVGVREQVDQELRSGVARVNDLLDRVAELNQQISRLEGGQGGAHTLRDERDRVLREVSGLIDISTVAKPAGTVDVFVGSTPVVLNDRSRGVKLEFTGENDVARLRLAEGGDILKPTSGKLAALIASREADAQHAIDTLDTFANQLMYEVNRLHSSGQGSRLFAELTSVAGVEDTAAALDEAGLPFEIVNGSFVVHVTQPSTGQRTSHRIDIDLGNGGGGTSLDDVAAAIDAVDMVSAALTADGRLRITAASSDARLSFSADTSGFLAAVGLNTFFAGTDASDMDVHAMLKDSPNYLATGEGHASGSNGTAKAIAAAGEQPVEAFNGTSLRGYWSRHVEDYAARLGQAKQQVEATGMIAEGLQSQWQAHSGVNIDEEAIDMLAWQRSYQGAARFITVVDELMQTLLSLTR